VIGERDAVVEIQGDIAAGEVVGGAQVGKGRREGRLRCSLLDAGDVPGLTDELPLPARRVDRPFLDDDGAFVLIVGVEAVAEDGILDFGFRK
jgi:hypothetical protein